MIITDFQIIDNKIIEYNGREHQSNTLQSPPLMF